MEFALLFPETKSGFRGEVVRIVLSSVQLRAGTFSLTADDLFSEGVHMISGRIGSGKSTLGSALAGLSLVESGQIILEGCRSRVF